MYNEYNTLEPSLNHPTPLICGKIVFHETGPWCQKGWDCGIKSLRVQRELISGALLYPPYIPTATWGIWFKNTFGGLSG